MSIYALLSALAVGLSTTASAGSQLSPIVRIVVLEAGVTPNTLRLGVRKRIMIYDDDTLDKEILSFNPARCADRQSFFIANGAAAPTQYDVFDLQLNPTHRSAEEQRQLLNAVLVSFTTSRQVQLYVRDDLCSSTGGRVAAGIVVVN